LPSAARVGLLGHGNTSEIIDKDLNTEQKDPNREDKETPLKEVASKQQQQRQHVT
jgi:hypothetical protein